MITRPRAQAAEWCQTLRVLGAEPLVCPTIRIVPPADWQSVDHALAQLPQFDWLIFTSANGVRFFCARLCETGRDVTALYHLKVAAVGPQTARALQHHALHVDVVPTSYRAQSLRESFHSTQLQSCHVLWPRAAVTQETLAPTLRSSGARVTEIVVYRTVQESVGVATLRQRLRSNTVDVVTFTSSSAVTALRTVLDEASWSILQSTVVVACIGPETTHTARAAGLPVHVVPAEATVAALTQAIVDYFGPQTAGSERSQRP